MKLHYQMYTPEDYEYDKNEIIKLAENNIKSKNGKNIYNKLWNIDTWDVCFSSFYGFPSKKRTTSIITPAIFTPTTNPLSNESYSLKSGILSNESYSLKSGILSNVSYSLKS